MIAYGNTIDEAARALRSQGRGATSAAAHHRHSTTGAKASHRDRVLSMWEWLAKGGLTPCSTKTAAALVTEMLGENYFSAGQTNYDVIRKRTADIMSEAPSPLRLIEGRTDPDGVARDQYEVAG